MDLLLQHPHVDVSLDIPVQDGLPFEVSLNLQFDELHLNAGRHFWVEWFPCNLTARVEDFLDAVRGLLSGRYRIRERHVGRFAASATLERPENGRWIAAAQWSDFWTAILPWRRTEKILRVEAA
jgi:hypothetical protein